MEAGGPLPGDRGMYAGQIELVHGQNGCFERLIRDAMCRLLKGREDNGNT